MPDETIRALATAALESRVEIEQAKGILAERIGVSRDEAFSFMRSAARSQGLKLSALAAEVIHSPETPRSSLASSTSGRLPSFRSRPL